MIPIELTIEGFLSYQEVATIDFTEFDLACIAGDNGAGKSSILDAITWALFGRARKLDESLINLQSDVAAVTFEFSHEGNNYMVIRSNERGKTKEVNFYIQTEDGGEWGELTERTLRKTDALIEETLNLDYETFVNAIFFLQGDADQFTQQTPANRKAILSKILGLGVWEDYRKEVVELRKQDEEEITRSEGKIEVIETEIAKEEEWKSALSDAEKDLEHTTKELEAQQKICKTAQNQRNHLIQLEKEVNRLTKEVGGINQKIDTKHKRKKELEVELFEARRLIEAGENIRKEVEELAEQEARLRETDQLARDYQKLVSDKKDLEREIESERERLRNEQDTLLEERARINENKETLVYQQETLETWEKELSGYEELLNQKNQLENDLENLEDTQEGFREQVAKIIQQVESKTSVHKLLLMDDTGGCPTCDQPLTEERRKELAEKVRGEIADLQEREREINRALSEKSGKIIKVKNALDNLAEAEVEKSRVETEIKNRKEKIDEITQKIRGWKSGKKNTLQAISDQLETDKFAVEERQALAEIEEKIEALGYDKDEHDRLLVVVSDGEEIRERKKSLEEAQDKITGWSTELRFVEGEIEGLIEENNKLHEALEDNQKKQDDLSQTAYDLETQEKILANHEEELINIREHMAKVQDRLYDIETAKVEKKEYVKEIEDTRKVIADYKTLENAFGKNGIPALLIEQAIPQIEDKANDILERLSGGEMSVEFVTQKEYKSKDALRETLDIMIQDSSGARDYEMYSGGEAFRVNFAIRLALSSLLANRAGSRLQTLIIDEGFGSQDANGRDRLIEAIASVRKDFKKILVITHVEGIKDAFSNQLLVEKTKNGSQIRRLA